MRRRNAISLSDWPPATWSCATRPGRVCAQLPLRTRNAHAPISGRVGRSAALNQRARPPGKLVLSSRCASLAPPPPRVKILRKSCSAAATPTPSPDATLSSSIGWLELLLAARPSSFAESVARKTLRQSIKRCRRRHKLVGKKGRGFHCLLRAKRERKGALC